jgi:hypothetical protein
VLDTENPLIVMKVSRIIKSSTFKIKNMTKFLKPQTYKPLLLIVFAALSVQHLSAQNSPRKRNVYIVPFQNERDTLDGIEDAGKKWFKLNKKTDDGDETQYKYIRAQPSPSGSTVIIVVQRTSINRAGIGGALRPKKETNREEVWTNIEIDSVDNRGLGRTLERKNESDADKFEGGAMGVAMALDSNKNKLVPLLRYDNNNRRGKQFIKFDGIEGNTLIDRKLNVTTFEKSITQVQRADEALKQNPNYNIRYEVPPNRVNAMKRLLTKARVNNSRITVVAVKP